VILSILLVIGFLIAVTALYVAAELSVVAVRRGQVRQLAEDGNWLAARLLPIVDNPTELDRAIAACQIGITVSSLALGAYGQATLAPLLSPLFTGWGGWGGAAAQSSAAAAILIGLTVLHMILGELLPKSIALEFPLQTSTLTALPLSWSLRLFSPLLYLFNGSGLLLLKILRVKVTRHHHVHSPGEIDLLLADTSPDGELDVEDRRRLRRALRLGTRRARDLMAPRSQIVGFDVDTPVTQVLTLVAESPFTRLPVYRGSLDHVVGVLHTKDVLLRQMAGRPPQTITDLVRPAVMVPAQAGADQVLVLLREKRVQLALVTGEGNALVGLITLEDVLSEVFGALTDELKGEVRRRRGR
jgi:CBS domain containing-hemolysin-like protein